MSYMWLYKESLETGVMVRLDEVDAYIKEGWLDTPDKWGKKGVQPVDGWEVDEVVKVVEEVDTTLADDDCSLEDMSKDELELYAREVFGVELDKRKSKANLIKQIEELENG